MDDTSWLEVSLTVDGELAEAVAEVLRRYIPSGVVIESTAVTANDDDSEGRAVGLLKVYGFLRVDDSEISTGDGQLRQTQRKIEESLWYLSRIRPLPQVQYRTVHEVDWSESWKQHYHPIKIGNKFIIVPAWLNHAHPGRIEIRMDPGMAFGTGTHPTTQLCLEYIEECISPGMNVIDIGCGSGILSIGALKLGASHALAVDNDADAVRVSRENALINVLDQELETGLGSVAEVLSGEFSIRHAPLVFANILAPVIISLLDDGMGNVIQPGGQLVLSGIIETQVDGVIKAIERNDLRMEGRKQIQDWVALLCQRSPDAQSTTSR